jgi:hypothetical protein
LLGDSADHPSVLLGGRDRDRLLRERSHD